MTRWTSLATVLALSLAAMAPHEARAAAAPRAGTLEWTPIQFETQGDSKRKVDAERGRLWVRETPGDSTCPLIELALVRFKSTSKQPGPPIVYLAGGPGGSGTRSAAGDRFPLFMALRDIADVIAFDQRGVLSKPFPVCRDSAPREPLDRPADRTVGVEAARARAEACARRLAAEGVNVAAYTTESNADDLLALREALGVPKISLWSISYGTHLALAMLRRHESSVHRAILAGTEGPDHTLKLPSTYERQLGVIDSLIGRDPAARRVVPDLRASLRTLLDQLGRTPATVDIEEPRTRRKATVTVGAFDLQLIAGEMISERDDIARIPAAVRAMLAGDFSQLATNAAQRRTQTALPAMALSMDCASGVSEERLARIRREAPTTLLGDAMNHPFMELCEAWPHRDLGPTFRAPVRTAVPTLFISGTLDARTPPDNAEEVRAGFANSEHLVIEGGGHDDDLFLPSPQILATMEAFLRGQPLPTRRVVLPPIRFETGR